MTHHTHNFLTSTTIPNFQICFGCGTRIENGVVRELWKF